MDAAPPLTRPLAAHVVKVLGMLGSDHDGEVAAAGRMAHSMLKAMGLTWGDVIKPAAPKPEPQQQSRAQRRWRRPTSPSDTAALCLQWSEVLTEWEVDFCRSM